VKALCSGVDDRFTSSAEVAKTKCEIGVYNSGPVIRPRSGSSGRFSALESKPQHSLSNSPLADCLVTVSGPASCRPSAVRRTPLRRWAPLLTAIGAVPVLTGCLLTADPINPALDVPTGYRTPHSTAKAELPSAEWWRGFRSRELTELIDQALAANYDIAAAVGRIMQADAQARVTGAALLPTLDASGNTTRSGTSGSGPASTPSSVHSVALNASYVVDFWGRNRDLLRSAEFGASASRFDRDLIALATMASVADAYFLVLEAQARIRVNTQNVASSERILKLIQDRFNNGTAAALDVAQQASVVAIQRAALPPLIQQRDQNRAALALLVGRAPEQVVVHGGDMYRLGIPRVNPGLPSDLLTRRPDVREAEAKLEAANANVVAARAAFFPTIQLTGQGGFSSAALRTLFGPGASLFTVAASASQPIFDGGTLLGQLDLQKGSREELMQDYRKVVLSAFTDVEKALVAVEQLTRQEQLQRDAVAQSQKAFDLSEERLQGGTIDLTTLLATEQTLFAQQDTLAQVRFTRLEAIVSLFQALGGGWSEELGSSEAEGGRSSMPDAGRHSP
jgi:outer membrane protein, multidrug efflux system